MTSQAKIEKATQAKKSAF